MNYLDIKKKIEGLRLRGAEKVNIAEAMYCIYYPITGNKKDLESCLLRIVSCLITNEINTRIDKGASIGFVFSNSYKNRSDHREAFHTLTERFSKKAIFEPSKRRICVANLKYLSEVFSWFIEFKKEFRIEEALYYTSMLLFGVVNADYIIKQIEEKHIKKVVVFSDMHMIDSLIVQKCNAENITTFTLQHGNFETEVPFVLSESKYFLAYGEYTKRKAVSFGMAPERIIKTAVLRQVDCLPPTRMKANTPVNRIGIILSGYDDRNSDICMIRFFMEYCRKNNLELFVKCHPHYGKDKYPEINWTEIKDVYCEEIDATQFRERIDLAVVLTSTVFVEYVLTLFPALIFVPGEDVYFQGIDWCKFRNEKEFSCLLKRLEAESEYFEKELLTTRKYFSENDNASDAYFHAISDYE